MKAAFTSCILIAFTLLAVSSPAADERRRWKTPRIVKWSDAEIVLGGVEPSQLQEFCVWSLQTEEILWSVACIRRKDYSKKSQSSSFQVSYGEVHSEWKQYYPYQGKLPRRIQEGETVCVSLSWAYPFMFGIRGDSERWFFRKTNGKYEQLSLDWETKKVGEYLWYDSLSKEMNKQTQLLWAGGNYRPPKALEEKIEQKNGEER